jgi:GR25 family glycosyltransferase involved in LPS biosynthesis
VNNPIKRHAADFWTFRHDRVESAPEWKGVGQIFIINVDWRRDRYDSVLRELATAKAPFDRVTRVPACQTDPGDTSQAGGQMACLRSHIETLRRAQAQRFDHVLVLEDDFCFTSDVGRHLTDLRTFFEREYDYWICLTATSKYGAVMPKDDLLSFSFQPCTNTGGYLVSREGLDHVLPVFEEALERLRATGDCIANAVDRCWAVLQPSGKFLVFRRKFGFQASSFSDIERSISRYLD